MHKTLSILALISIIALLGCSTSLSQEDKAEPNTQTKVDKYIEYRTELLDEEIIEIPSNKWPGIEDMTFLHDGYSATSIKRGKGLGYELDCPPNTIDKQDCEVTTDYTIPDGFGEIGGLEAFLLDGKEYMVFKPKNDENFYIFEDQKEIYKETLNYGANGAVREIKSINGETSIVFNQEIWLDDEEKRFCAEAISDEDTIKCNNPESRKIVANTLYQGETLNEKYDLDGSYAHFEYNGKSGFIAKKGEDHFILFDGQKITGNFDQIRIESCCSITAYPFTVYENGILFFAAERDGKIIYVEVNLPVT